MALNLQRIVVMVALATVSAAPVWAQSNPLEVQQQGTIAYVTGGIGQDETDALIATQSSYNLRIMNADKSGHFSGDVRIVISDLKHNMLLDAISGPLFYVNLPKGRYVVEAYGQDLIKKQTVSISSTKPARIRFVWPEDMSDATNY